MNKILDMIIILSNAIGVWAWRKRYSKTRMNRYKEVKNKKLW
jgi:hypothetical protein